MKHKICLDKQEFTQKPSNIDAGLISGRLATLQGDVTIEELSTAIEAGRTWSPGTYSESTRKARFWNQQSLYCADIDDGNLSLEDILNIDSVFKPCLIHKSFSWTESKKKWRVIFQFDKALTEAPLALATLRYIRKTYNCDRCIVDLARLFYGGGANSVVYLDSSIVNSYDSIDYGDYLSNPNNNNDRLELLKPLEEKDLKKSNSVKGKRACQRALTKVGNLDNSGYLRVWHSARILAQSGCFTTEQIKSKIFYFMDLAGDFEGWDKNPVEIIENAIKWTVKVRDEEL